MIYAAGFGTRMGDLTKDRPKPLIEVAGRALLDHALQLLPPGTHAVVNTHYHADQIARHLIGQRVFLSHEAHILETGGGLRAAMPLLGGSPVMTLNSDAIWTGPNPLAELAAAWDGDRMDALLLLAPTGATTGYHGTGDFLLDKTARLIRANGQLSLVYLGAQILCTDLLPNVPQRAFSLNLIWDQIISQGRAYGLLHDGGWCDVGHPAGIAEAEHLLGWPSRG